MAAQSGFAILRYLIKDTFQQARTSGVSWMMLAITALCTALCLSVTVSGDISLRNQDEPVLFLPHARTLQIPSSPAEGKPIASAIMTDAETSAREGIETVKGRVTLAFGAVSFPIVRERDDAVFFLELLFAGGIAGTCGLLMLLVWTAGFVPSFLEPSAATVLLAKPVGAGSFSWENTWECSYSLVASSRSSSD